MAFLVPNLVNFIFSRNLQLYKFDSADFKYENSFFKFYPANTKRRDFWSQIWGILLFCQILQVDKFEGAYFKYDNSFLKFYPKNTQIRHFWCQTKACFFANSHNQTNLRVLISNMRIFF